MRANSSVKLYREAVNHRKQLNKVFWTAANSLVKALDARDHYTADHSKKVAGYSKAIAATMGLSPEKQETIYLAGLLHDIGKIGITKTYLNKPGKLTNTEWLELKKHPILGYQIINEIPGLQRVVNMILYHHERVDGRGYPNKISGCEIPLGAKIICVADSFDAMTSKRIYKSAMSEKDAVEELIRCAGTQFDPDIVKAFCYYVDNRMCLAI